ncbi:MAG TPA: peptidoglycan-binding protein [Candidatus Paceibacterota bacterium]
MINKFILFSALSIFLLIPIYPAEAITLEELQIQIQQLINEINKLRGAQPLAVIEFNRNLYYGLENDGDVVRLQDTLIKKGFLKEGLNTGNYFGLTLDAVRMYQRFNGILPTGYFGPITREKLNSEIKLQNDIAFLELRVEELRAIEKQNPKPFEESAPSTPSEYQLIVKPNYDLDFLAMKIHDFINTEREQEGLSILAWDNNVAKNLALPHSEDQARDNIEITDPDLLCHYPLIRHEGFVFGYSLGDRLINRGINYLSAGENIVMFSVTKDLVYSYESDNPPLDCPQVVSFMPGEGSKEERTALYQSVLNESLAVVRALPDINWVNKNWLNVEEMAAKAVQLWLSSPPHKENLLRSGYNYSGVGIAMVNDYLIITQNFIRR